MASHASVLFGKKHDDDEDNEQQAKATAGKETPTGAIRPSGQCGKKQQEDEDNDKWVHAQISPAHSPLAV